MGEQVLAGRRAGGHSNLTTPKSPRDIRAWGRHVAAMWDPKCLRHSRSRRAWGAHFAAMWDQPWGFGAAWLWKQFVFIHRTTPRIIVWRGVRILLDTHGHKHLTMLGYVVGPNLLLFYMMAYRWFASLQESRLKTFPRILDFLKKKLRQSLDLHQLYWF